MTTLSKISALIATWAAAFKAADLHIIFSPQTAPRLWYQSGNNLCSTAEITRDSLLNMY